MNRNPFRHLDVIDPSPRWDDVLDRARLAPTAYDEGPDLDVGQPSATRTAALVAVAAVAAVLLGVGVVLAGAGGADPDTRAEAPLGPAAAAPTGVTGACPFTLGSSDLAPGPAQEIPATLQFDPEQVTQGHGTVDGLTFDVAVGSFTSSEAIPLGPADDPALSVSLSGDGTRGYASVRAGVEGGAGPCDDLIATVHLPLSAEEAADLGVAGQAALSSDRDDLTSQARPHLERILASVLATG